VARDCKHCPVEPWTWAQLRDEIDALCMKLGKEPEEIEVELEPPEPSAPPISVGHSKRFDGKLTILITTQCYNTDHMMYPYPVPTGSAECSKCRSEVPMEKWGEHAVECAKKDS
jgi:hypothetical protein